MEILGVAGSLRRGSYNRMLLRAAGASLPPGVRFTEYDGLKAIPAFDEDDEASLPLSVSRWRAAIAGAGGILFATPEYNSSVPGHLKNAIDWASRPFSATVLRNKPVAVIGASTGMFGAVWSQAETRKALAAAGARVIDRELAVPFAHEAFDEAGSLRDGDLTLELDNILVELLDAIKQRVVA
ncbi:MAG: NAD(P)H-dependent oxidoreductase [Solirubrobacterales bacterium]|nr:NAD(P)H-dependent oxidoreductase [Solirubrobacterales bacterium]MBV9798758.1 NAD(P)H-dependent oxidoreductase [Solirubrobacterales bacterium]